jgi:hypothetical protein
MAAILMVITRHWGQFLALFGLGNEGANFAPMWKQTPLPSDYVATVMIAVVVAEFIPYAEEFVRCWRARGRTLKCDSEKNERLSQCRGKAAPLISLF